MRAARALVRLIWGDDLDRPLRPVLGVTFASSAAGSGLWSFMAIWAVEELGAKSQLPFVYLVGAVLAGASGFLGGYLSDRIGRRRVILVGEAAMAVYPLVLLALSSSMWAALVALMFAGVFGSLGGSVAQAMVADLVPPERHEAAYSSVRVAANLGVVIGPPLGGLVLILGSWSALFPTIAILSALAWLVAWRYLPHRGEFSPEGPPERARQAPALSLQRELVVGRHGLDLAEPDHVAARPAERGEVAVRLRAEVPKPQRERNAAQRARAEVLVEVLQLAALTRRLRPGRVLAEDRLPLVLSHVFSTAEGSPPTRRRTPTSASPPRTAATTPRSANSVHVASSPKLFRICSPISGASAKPIAGRCRTRPCTRRGDPVARAPPRPPARSAPRASRRRRTRPPP